MGPKLGTLERICSRPEWRNRQVQTLVSEAQTPSRIPRVAFLADSFHEVNGVARTCREFAAFARRQGYPFFSVRFGRRESFERTGPFWEMEFTRGQISWRVDPDLRFDLTFFRLLKRLEARLRDFSPDLIHLMSPGELGILRHPEERRAMGAEGRARMLARPWEDVFRGVYQAYETCFEPGSG